MSRTSSYGSILVLTALLALAAIGDTPPTGKPPQGPYLKSCQGASMDGSKLLASCQRFDGSWVDASLDLVNGCGGNVSNFNGMLKCTKTGTKTIYVGNLPFFTSEEEVRVLFWEFGPVEELHWVTDRDTGRFRGFCFVQMSDGADTAIQALYGREFNGRALAVSEMGRRFERHHPERERYGDSGRAQY